METPWEPALRAAVEAAYGVAVTDAAPMSGRWGAHARVRLSTDAGPLFLKERSWLLRDDEFDAHLAIQAHVHRQAPGQAPELVRTTDGAPSMNHRGRRFALHEWITATGPVRDLVREHADLLATLATMTAWPAGDWRTPTTRGAWCPDRPDLFPDYLRTWRQAGPADDLIARALAASDACDWTTLPEQCLHGDPAPFNVVQHGPTTTWIDFECARWGYRLWDVARTLVLAHVLERDEEDGPLRVSGSWPTRALARDAAVFALTDREMTALPHVLAVATAVIAISELGLDDPDPDLRQDARAYPGRISALLSAPPPDIR